MTAFAELDAHNLGSSEWSSSDIGRLQAEWICDFSLRAGASRYPLPIGSSIRSAISSLAKLTRNDELARWPSGAPSQPNGRLGLGVLRHTQMTGRYSDRAVALRLPTLTSSRPEKRARRSAGR